MKYLVVVGRRRLEAQTKESVRRDVIYCVGICLLAPASLASVAIVCETAVVHKHLLT